MPSSSLLDNPRKAARFLGVPENGDERTIRKAYRARALELHPDRNQGSAAATVQFQQLRAAVDLLIRNDAPLDAASSSAEARGAKHGARRAKAARARNDDEGALTADELLAAVVRSLKEASRYRKRETWSGKNARLDSRWALRDLEEQQHNDPSLTAMHLLGFLASKFERRVDFQAKQVHSQGTRSTWQSEWTCHWPC
jgi:curved DNA-binding protein CbpA